MSTDQHPESAEWKEDSWRATILRLHHALQPFVGMVESSVRHPQDTAVPPLASIANDELNEIRMLCVALESVASSELERRYALANPMDTSSGPAR